MFGGTRQQVLEVTSNLQAYADHHLLIGADLERGAGQQVRGLAQLPPALALRRMREHTRLGGPVGAAAAYTASEARRVGINWVLAPVLDLDIEPDNPIVQTRSFGEDPAVVAACAAEWIYACQAVGPLACAKHFPGHGRTTLDSHATLPVVHASRELLEADLAPFRAAVEAGVASIMTAHVAYPALDPSGSPATFSMRILDRLRRDLAYGGLVVRMR
jgi:beta-glucosidase-like glycosyl hydrolase